MIRLVFKKKELPYMTIKLIRTKDKICFSDDQDGAIMFLYHKGYKTAFWRTPNDKHKVYFCSAKLNIMWRVA